MSNLQRKLLKALIVGKPNVGKSTLLNFLVGEKVSIVSRKAQTTQRNTTGVITKNESQLIFFSILFNPGVSKNINWLSFFVITPVVFLWVVCAFRETIDTFSPTRKFSKVLLPTLGFPTINAFSSFL